jgi:hypothetical protein
VDHDRIRAPLLLREIYVKRMVCFSVSRIIDVREFFRTLQLDFRPLKASETPTRLGG